MWELRSVLQLVTDLFILIQFESFPIVASN